uniref:Vacuolar ATPase assembly protein VMA22 n=1 Tax=Glossina palpalis gambiensis TaxID=67801 RepID=A0A1B0BBX9_9MUSC
MKGKIEELLDALYLELLHLIEQQTECRVNIERLTKAGLLLLAKTRYVSGMQTVSVAQLPTENSEDFKALCRVVERSDEEAVSGHKIQLIRSAVEKSEGYYEPLHFFNILVPSSLRNAAEQYKKSIALLVESANIQREMLAVMENIKNLKILKKQF